MKIQTPISEFGSGLGSDLNQMYFPYHDEHVVDATTSFAGGISRAVNPGFSFKKQIARKEYTASERKVRAEAFVERSGRLRYYIGLIQLKVVI